MRPTFLWAPWSLNNFFTFCTLTCLIARNDHALFSSNRGASHLNEARRINDLGRGSALGYEILTIYIVWMPGLQHPRGWLDVQYLAHPFDGMFDVIVPPRFSVRRDCSASLLAFGTLCCLAVSLIHQHPLWWCRHHDLLNDPVLSRGCLICRVHVCVRVCVCIHVGVLFVLFFVFVWSSRSSFFVFVFGELVA